MENKKFVVRLYGPKSSFIPMETEILRRTDGIWYVTLRVVGWAFMFGLTLTLPGEWMPFFMFVND